MEIKELFIKAIQSRYSWLALMVLGIVLEGCGLYFQYGLDLPPCINCVYERAIYLYAFIIPGALGVIFCKSQRGRIVLLSAMTILALIGLYIVYQHLGEYYNFGSSQCALFADFVLIPLDKLLPAVFAPQGACGPLEWSLLGLSMPIWIGLSYLGLLGASILGLVVNLIKAR